MASRRKDEVGPGGSGLLRTRAQWAVLALCALLGAALFAFVDLTPRVEADFFFSTDDAGLQDASNADGEFGAAPQVFVIAAGENLFSRDYLQRIGRLTNELGAIDGVLDIRSLTRGPDDLEDIGDSPFWSRLLLAPDRSASFLVLRFDEDDHARIVGEIDAILAAHVAPGFALGASGVPYVAEHVRQRLTDELRRFSIAAFVVFGLLVALLFRSIAVVAGTMIAALTASFATFLVRAAIGMETDILAPNLWTIAFVLTISHIVYLTAQWQRHAREHGNAGAVDAAIRLVGPVSAWSLAANLLGFASLMFVSARPLRLFGISGAIAAVLAILCAYLLYPVFLRAARPTPERAGALSRRLDRVIPMRHPRLALAVAVATVVLAPFAWRVNTDPALPTYFSEGDPIRTGIEAFDRAGGSSPLDVVVADAGNQPFDDDEMEDRLQVLQRRLERHEDAGAVLSIALLMGEAERPWYSFLFSWETKLDELEKPEYGRIGRTFISADRQRARFILRMHEEARTRPREAVIADIRGIVDAQGFRTVSVGGLYPLQGELSALVQGSVLRGLAGLLAAFAVIVFIVSRSVKYTLAMLACLAITPLALFGIVGLTHMPLDIIAAPAANVALPLGIDEMLHLGDRVRRARGRIRDEWQAWNEALTQMWRPILASMLIVASGFALLLLSDFPPTRRLGVLVCIGAVLTDLIVLVVLPAIATLRLRRA